MRGILQPSGQTKSRRRHALRLLARIKRVQAEPDRAMNYLREAEKILLESTRDLALLKKVQSELSSPEQGKQQRPTLNRGSDFYNAEKSKRIATNQFEPEQ